MAQRVEIVLTDDIDGSEATETISFGLDGSTYEIDLNSENASALRESLARFVDNGRRTSTRRRTGRAPNRPGGSTSSSARTRQIREWAQAQGLEVSDRGRIPAGVQQAYDAAH